ncbi:GIY-YIG nuclease family protein [Candidatus Saccharibacteria bacterium]|nr:GIY-YIG nuclease family protein [Candidatus Saccharibacteria bacterium]
MYYTYVLYSVKDRKHYIGCTPDLQARLESHQKGLVTSTVYRRPLKLIYYEACRTHKDALRREKYLKTHYGKMFLDKRLKSDSRG